ncbi:hypothetical protein FRC98_13285 [Lujinxingia vulgaris]|uniref:Uncharacterized protein n=1 Tax=Lujinxingia vulgaris TaxID=2600176 RepID=A0A5C6X2Q2_9DELT|nr:hypothetical protein [Lujinxingia vulgaris]TXD36093.1 hypothetical protein FRC98_13285 [Lujinxingia vulgaris]
MGMKIGQSAAPEARAGEKSATSLAGAKAARRGGDPGAFAALLKEAPMKDSAIKDAPLKDGVLKDAPLLDEAAGLAGEQDARLEGDYYERAVEQGAVQRGDKGWSDAGVQARGGAQNGEETQGAKAGSEEGWEGGDVRGEEDAAVVVEEGFQPERGVVEVGEAKSEEVGGGPAELGEIVEAMVKAAQVGEDAQGRKVMFLELDVPGRGTLRVRLLKEHDGYAVRMRASDEGLARELLSSQSEMVRGAGARGVRLNAVEIVT